MPVFSKKICMVGDFGVGKTSLVRRFLDRQFSDHYLSTIGVKISRKFLSVTTNSELNQDLHLMIWDIEGKTQFKSITPHYLEGAMGAVIVADLNRPETIEHIQDHLQLLSVVNSKTIPCMVALNKVDTFDNGGTAKALETLTALQAHPQVVAVCPTSAKTGQQVDQMFEALAQRLLENDHALIIESL